MILTHFFKSLKIDLSGERAIALSVDIDRTLLKRMHVGARAHVPLQSQILSPDQPQIPIPALGFSSSADLFAGISAQLSDLTLQSSLMVSQEAQWRKQQNNMAYVCSSIRLVHCLTYGQFLRVPSWSTNQ